MKTTERELMNLSHSRSLVVSKWLAACAACAAAVLVPSLANAQIKSPGAHPDYSVELEPHLALQYHRWDDGVGPGLRVNIPFFHNGPIDSINNNMAIGFGFDWIFVDDDHFRGCDDRFRDCDATQVWFPVVLQWNFWFTDIISVFGEPGIAARYIDYDNDFCRGDCDDFDFFEPVFWGGARFQFSDVVGLTVRVGTPYVSVGANFLL